MADDVNQRVDNILVKKFPDSSRSYWQKQIRSQKVLVNNQPIKTGYSACLKDHVIILPDTENLEIVAAIRPEAEQANLDIIYEDEFLLVINKPPGLCVHQGNGLRKLTLVDILLAHKKHLSSVGQDMARPGIVHRLDEDTSGLMVVAKDDWTHRKLQEQFATKTAKRLYRAILLGVLPQKEFRADSLISRDPHHRTKFRSEDLSKKNEESQTKQRQAISIFRTQAIFMDRFSLVEVELLTGRTHQIRVHAENLKAPVLGDRVYGVDRQKHFRLVESKWTSIFKLASRQMLHAYNLKFIHPILKKNMDFAVKDPEDLNLVLSKIQELCGVKT